MRQNPETLNPRAPTLGDALATYGEQPAERDQIFLTIPAHVTRASRVPWPVAISIVAYEACIRCELVDGKVDPFQEARQDAVLFNLAKHLSDFESSTLTMLTANIFDQNGEPKRALLCCQLIKPENTPVIDGTPVLQVMFPGDL